MSEGHQLPNAQQAHEIIVGLHKRAFFGRLAQYGIQPPNAQEAEALLDLGVGLAHHAAAPDQKQAAAAPGAEYGNGFFANCLYAFDNYVGQQGAAPGFEGIGKQANRLTQQKAAEGPEAELSPQMVDACYQTAYQLAQDPAIYSAAVVKRASNEAELLEQMKQAGYFDLEGQPKEEGAPAAPNAQ
jgi:hypothetical protein